MNCSALFASLQATHIMYALGFIGQVAFFSRFLLQWLVSEVKKESVIPELFWYLSIIGSALLLIYSIYRKDPVFIFGQSFGFIVYIRNIILIKRKQKKVLLKSEK
ncbi:MAG: lipid-A-disaccharide synthase N-terminal domain-containing protein [Candidatus Auribacterota bacterium]|jgi:lipid-A-disaccharide synthase-like uncharacterized protein|nr:lipid-A-disaccharide synthase N-terminal domain-containing protein [Candidatus Auribacterota bacterium]